MTYISWSSEFGQYLLEYSIDLHDTLDNELGTMTDLVQL